MVRNQTLEDWEDVDLTVSTASAQPVEAINPTPYFVDVYTPDYGAVTTRSAAPMDMKKEKARDGLH